MQEWIMKKDIIIHFSSLIILFILISLIKQWFSFSYWLFWLGGIIGTLLPDLDHFIYVYYLRPQELISQRVNYLIEEKNIFKSIELLYQSRYERTKIIFHTVFFLGIFIALTFFVISSSGSLFGKGIVMAFYLHLIIDQAMDLKILGNLDNWFKQVPFVLDKQKYIIFFVANLILLLLFAFFL